LIASAISHRGQRTNWENAVRAIKQWVDRNRYTAWALAPYAAALLLPGGTLLAGALWLYRQRKSARVSP
jgi:hypothetical protein